MGRRRIPRCRSHRQMSLIGGPSYPPCPMQTRLLLIASALLAVIILVAGAIWLIRLLA